MKGTEHSDYVCVDYSVVRITYFIKEDGSRRISMIQLKGTDILPFLKDSGLWPAVENRVIDALDEVAIHKN